MKEDKKNSNERLETKPYIHCEELTLELSETDESMDDITPGQTRDKSAVNKTTTADHQVQEYFMRFYSYDRIIIFLLIYCFFFFPHGN